MASFQNMEALKAQLMSMSKEQGTRYSSDHYMNAVQSLLGEQEWRLQRLEKEILSLTKAIRPDSDTSWTLVDYTSAMETLQVTQSKQLKTLQQLLGIHDATTNATGKENLSNGGESGNVERDVAATDNAFAPLCALRGPLHVLVEAEYETDGTRTTPGSMLSPNGWTPPTPSLSRVSGSTRQQMVSSTTEQSVSLPFPRPPDVQQSFLDLEEKLLHEIHNSHGLMCDKSHPDFAVKGQNTNGRTAYGNDESVESTHTSIIAAPRSAAVNSDHLEQSVESSVQDESLNESTDDSATRLNSSQTADSLPSTAHQNVAQSRARSHGQISGASSATTSSSGSISKYEDEDTLDDSALYCATVLKTEHPVVFLRPERTSGRANMTPDKLNLTHIDVDTSLPSPTATNITLDMSMYPQNEHVVPPDSRRESLNTSVDSEETAFLDRYRLDFDELSPHGVHVVPNPRGWKKRDKQQATYASNLFTKATSPAQAANIPVSKPKYRKTPYPKKRTVPSTPTIDENSPMNFSDDQPSPSLLVSPEGWTHRDATLSSTVLYASLSMPRTPVIDVPPLRRSLASVTTTKALSHCEPNDARSISGMGNSKLSPHSNQQLKSAEPRRAVSLDSSRRAFQILPVTMLEYEQAPRVVKLLVEYKTIQMAVDRLNVTASWPMSLAQASLLLEEPERIVKSTLMSLCHMRRLVMRKTSNELIFDIA